MSMTRRSVLAGLAAGAFAPAASAHTLYNQWIVYRRKTLLIGSHRKDLRTYEFALELAETVNHMLPEASARAARAPHPERLASLLATRQMDLAMLAFETASAIRAGDGPFSPYGPVPLTAIAAEDGYLLAAHRDFTPHHGWLIAAALDEGGSTPGTGVSDFDLHEGVAAYLAGMPVDSLKPGRP